MRAGVFLSALCVCTRVSVWVNGERERATARQRERREVVREVQYSIYKLALYEELERCVRSCACIRACLRVYKNMIQLLIGAFVRGPIPVCLSLYVHSHVFFKVYLNRILKQKRKKNTVFITIDAQ